MEYSYKLQQGLSPAELFFWIVVDKTLEQLGALILRQHLQLLLANRSCLQKRRWVERQEGRQSRRW